MSDAVILLIGAIGVVIAALVLRRTRHERGASSTVVGGVVLTLAGIAAGLLLLPVEDAPSESLGAVGFVPPPPVQPGRGFAVGFGVTVNGCTNPVDVSVVAAGTRGYWIDHPARRRDPVWSRFSLILPGSDLQDLHVGLSDDAGSLTTPTLAVISPSEAPYIHPDPPVRKDGETVISGWIAYWPQTLEPVVARFRAPWLIRRGLSTCYLKLPELSGTPTVIAAEAALAPRQLRAYGISARTLVHSQNTTGSYAPALEITHGTTMVAVTSGEVMSDASLPPPSALSYGEPAWTCQSLAASAGPLPASPRGSVPDILEGRRGTGAGFSEQVIARAAAGDCRAVATIAEDSAAYSRDLVLLAVGAVTSLGITLLVQTLLGWLDRLGGHGPPESTATRGSPTPTGEPGDSALPGPHTPVSSSERGPGPSPPGEQEASRVRRRHLDDEQPAHERQRDVRANPTGSEESG